MDNSEEHFQELLAHAVARANRMLRDRGAVVTFGLTLHPDAQVQVAVAVPESGNTDPTPMLLKGLQAKVADPSILACCIVVPQSDAEGRGVLVRLENNENYCAQVRIPVTQESPPSLDVEAMFDEDGYVQVFPLLPV